MNYDYSYSGPMNSGTAAAFGVGMLIYWVIMMAVCVAMIIALWKVYEKAGRPGWGAIIPFYNYYLLFDIAWGKGILFLLMLVPCVNVVVYIICMIKLAQAFGKSVGFGIGLAFLSPIFLLILGFGDAQYIGVTTQE